MTSAASRRTATPVIRTAPAPVKWRGVGWLAAILLALPLLITSTVVVWTRLARDEQASLAMEAANNLFASGDYPLAVQAYGQLIDRGADAAAVYFNLGLAAMEAGDLPGALEALRQAQALAPRNEEIARALARAEGEGVVLAAAGDPLMAGAQGSAVAGAADNRAERVWWRALSANEIVLTALLAWTLIAALIIVAVRRPRVRTAALVGVGLSVLLLCAAGGALIL